MSLHRYSPRTLAGDFARAAIGLAVCVGATAIAGIDGFIGWVFGICALVFALFGARTWLRSISNYELTDIGLTRSYVTWFGRFERALVWRGLKKFKLRFFPAKRDRSQGWMELALAGEGARMRLDSTLEDFEAIVRAALAAATNGRLALSDSTLSNLAALGIAAEDQGSGKGWGERAPRDLARR